jgi:hypothetical protein
MVKGPSKANSQIRGPAIRRPVAPDPPCFGAQVSKEILQETAHFFGNQLAATLTFRLIFVILTFYEYSLCDWPTFADQGSFQKANSDLFEY